MKFVAIALLFLSLLSISHEARACSCRQPHPTPFTDAASEADVIFIGRVMLGEVTQDKLRYRLVISDVFKGELGSEADIYSGFGGGDCGIGFRLNSEYLVYAHRNGSKLYTNNCSRTKFTSKFPEYLKEIDELSLMKSKANP